MKINQYECEICNKLSKRMGNKNNFKRFIGIRKDVRKHLVEIHGVKGRKNTMGLSKKELGKSPITENTIVLDWK